VEEVPRGLGGAEAAAFAREMQRLAALLADVRPPARRAAADPLPAPARVVRFGRR